MRVSLDGQELFESEQLSIEPGGIHRDFIERTVAGLDGVASVDLGGRGREIVQKGTLRAVSRAQMRMGIDAISVFMDGDTHKMVCDSGDEYDNLRMDMFKVGDERTSDMGVIVDYEIVYTQLRV
jgi:hypothetical protein